MPIVVGSWTPPTNEVEVAPLPVAASPVFADVARRVARRDYISNNILFVTATVTIPYGGAPAASSPVAISSAPSMDHSTMATSVTPSAAASPAANTQAPAPGPVAPVASSPAAVVPAASSPAAPPSPAQNAAPAASGSTLSADTIIKIMPNSASCANRDAQPGSCRTAAEAAPHLAKAFNTYGITSKGAQAANLALIAFESAEMVYKVGLDANTPGKGTYAVMMPPNVKKYATQLKGADAVTQAGNPVAILALVNTQDDDAFGSASWYMSTQCPDIQKQFDGDVDSAWTAYISTCVGGSEMAKRQPYWDAAKKAFGI
jgi:hypothetical protein